MSESSPPDAAGAPTDPTTFNTEDVKTLADYLAGAPSREAVRRPVDWRPFGLTVEHALNRGDDARLLFDENSPIRDELRALIALEREAESSEGWCPACGCGNDAANYAHLPGCRAAMGARASDEERICAECNGTGGDRWGDGRSPCQACRGRGRVA